MGIRYFNNECERIAKSCDLEFGKEPLLLNSADNLLNYSKQLNKTGFGVSALLNNEEFFELKSCVKGIIKKRLSAFQVVHENFELNEYHRFLESDDIHYKVSTWALEYTEIGNSFLNIKSRVEELLKEKLSVKKINHLGTWGEYIGFRILRPNRNDHNPFHRDAWISYWRDTVNVWIPLCGFEDGNSLQMIPKSHLWSDDKVLKTKAGVEIDGKKYHVSAAIGTVNKFSIETPELTEGQGLVFSPYLIHGNGVNRKSDVTRVSLEFRFCRA